jgi:hypothetical protein
MVLLVQLLQTFNDHEIGIRACLTDSLRSLVLLTVIEGVCGLFALEFDHHDYAGNLALEAVSAGSLGKNFTSVFLDCWACHANEFGELLFVRNSDVRNKVTFGHFVLRVSEAGRRKKRVSRRAGPSTGNVGQKP